MTPPGRPHRRRPDAPPSRVGRAPANRLIRCGGFTGWLRVGVGDVRYDGSALADIHGGELPRSAGPGGRRAGAPLLRLSAEIESGLATGRQGPGAASTVIRRG